MKLFHFFLNAKKNNKGYSLVEVIVAMLVLAIIAIPLLAGFSVVSKVNVNTRKQSYGNTVATNLVEAIKQFGIESVALQMHDRETFKLASNITAGDYGETLKDFDLTKALKYNVADPVNNPLQVPACLMPYPGGTKYKFLPRLTEKAGNTAYNNDYVRKYYFVIKGIKEGTMTYDAQITFDATDASYNSTPGTGNKFDLSNLNTLNSKRTALIAPSGVWYSTIQDPQGNEAYDTSKTFETEAIRVFLERYFTYQSDAFNKARELQTLTNAVVTKAIQEYINSGLISHDSFTNKFANYLWLEADLGKPLNIAEHGVNGTVTQEIIDRSLVLRTAAYNFYKLIFTTEWQEKQDAGVILEPDTYEDPKHPAAADPKHYHVATVIVDTTEMEQNDPLQLIGKTDAEQKSIIIKRIARTTTVVITLENLAYVVNSTTNFDLYQSIYEEILCDIDATDEVRNAALNYACEGYFEDKIFSTIENIYLFQDSLRTGKFGTARGDGKAGDQIIINTSALGNNMLLDAYGSNPADINLYLVWQYQNVDVNGNVLSLDQWHNQIDVVFAGTESQARKFNIYGGSSPTFIPKNQILPNTTPTVLANFFNKDKLVSDLENSDRAYKVTINVLEHDTTNVVYTTSTIIKE